MATKQLTALPMTLLGVSIVSSLLSLALLFAWPRHSGEWRTSLNVLSLVLVLSAIGVTARSRRRP
jgi:hypothetical protein